MTKAQLLAHLSNLMDAREAKVGAIDWQPLLKSLQDIVPVIAPKEQP